MTWLDVSGELVRKNLKEGEKGVDLYLDIQVVDIKSCAPIPNLAVEIWSANSTVSELLPEKQKSMTVKIGGI